MLRSIDLSTANTITGMHRIIAICGKAGSGKDTVAGLLQEQSYFHVSLSDYVRRAVFLEVAETNRPQQRSTANRLRQLHGSDYFIRWALSEVPVDEPKVVVSGVYAPGEAEWLLQLPDSTLVFVDGGTTEDRFARITRRSDGSRDALTLDQFRIAERAESAGTQPWEANVDLTAALATHRVVNGPTTSLDKLRLDVGALANTVRKDRLGH